MVLKILYAVGSTILPVKYYTHAVLAVIGIVTIYIFSQGRKTNRERDLHGRTILITVASISTCISSHDWLTQLACLREPSLRTG
jgi:hypothetical protein